MSLITFQDLPNTNTPINSENLNNNFEYLDTKKDIYSTSETLTNKIWNGKPVYRKIFEQSNLNAIATGITNEIIIGMTCCVKQNGINRWRTIPWLFTMNDTIGSNTWAGGFYYHNGEIRFQVGTDLGDVDYVNVVIEYTKS